jgi:hypothetical protein
MPGIAYLSIAEPDHSTEMYGSERDQDKPRGADFVLQWDNPSFGRGCLDDVSP